MSVFVKYNPWGRMGNRMFQYAFGYILAQRKETELFSEDLPNFNIPGNYKSPGLDSIYTHQYGNNYADVRELITTSKDVVVDSYLQKAIYYTPYRTILKEAFNIKDSNKKQDQTLVLHIRETDYKDINCFLGYDFYKHLITQTGFTDVVIVTDNSNCDTVQRLVAEGCKLYTEGYVNKFETSSNDRSMKDFNFMLNSSNLAISQSSFSWWAAFLGTHDNVYFPYTKNNGMWKLTPEQDDIDLYFDLGKSYRVIL